MTEQHEINPVPPPPNHEASELSPLEKVQQRIVEHLNDATLESPRFQAFCDIADREYAQSVMYTSDSDGRGYLRDMIGHVEETIRQRKNGTKGYKKEFDVIDTMRKDHYAEVWKLPHTYSNDAEKE